MPNRNPAAVLEIAARLDYYVVTDMDVVPIVAGKGTLNDSPVTHGAYRIGRTIVSLRLPGRWLDDRPKQPCALGGADACGGPRGFIVAL